MPEDEHHIDAEALRIMQAWPEVYGPGPWPVSGTLLGWGFGCDRGWCPLLERLSADLAAITREDGLTGFRVQQVKERFGELRFYCSDGNDRSDARITLAEHEAATTCEACGLRPARLRDQAGWLATQCDRCACATGRST